MILYACWDRNKHGIMNRLLRHQVCIWVELCVTALSTTLFRKLTNRERECVCRAVKVLSCLHRKKSDRSNSFYIPDYSPVDTVVELPVHTANAVFVERSKTYNLIGK